IVGIKTIRAIETYQRNKVGIKQPDGLIEPGKKTWASLSRLATAVTAPATSKPNQAAPTNPSQSSNNPPSPATTVKQIAWGAKVSKAFKLRAVEIANDLGVTVDYLMAAMAFETGASFSPSIKNAAGSGAVGLIQFMPSTAKALGTTSDKLAKMSAVEQLEYVKKYFTPMKGKLKTLEDVYMAILYPAAVGKSEDYALFSEGSKTYEQNKGFDANKDGVITVAEVSFKVRGMYQKGLTKGYLG
ncbi:MAG TPA: transglycosylase SLT domain-containing protein, partial [Cellvibrionaceae bacterium]|nr:transglycosylase SLT domain-containing protein [Cellvibrionaceae bacterium]